MSLWTVFGSEVVGTFILILLGVGVVANVVLPGTYGNGANWLLINFGWGIAVFSGVYAGASSGAHINPAVTLGIAVSGADEYAPDVPITLASSLVYVIGQLIGAFLGAVVAWLAYRKHYDAATEPVLGTFSTGPAIASPAWNVITEAIGTFVLVYIILRFGDTPGELGPLAVGPLLARIGASLGGPTGYAINPARDLGPRIAHAVLPIAGKGGNDWGYAWIPVVAPIIGGILGALAFTLLLGA